jgi:hypothetical protein
MFVAWSSKKPKIIIRKRAHIRRITLNLLVEKGITCGKAASLSAYCEHLTA